MTPYPIGEAPGARPPAPVRIVHLGIGNFFRAHQAWYTDRAPDAAEWGIAAFTGRSSMPPADLLAQDGKYTLVTRTAAGDQFDVVSSLSAVHGRHHHAAWLGYMASPDVAVVTVTVTEAGYRRGLGGGVDRDDPDVLADVAALRSDLTAPVTTAPGRLLAGLVARRRADAGPLTVLPCDNLPDNGAVTRSALLDLAAAIEPALAAWLDDSVVVASSMVDRITPRSVPESSDLVAREAGWVDHSPVVTEPFSEWVIAGTFPAGRPAWQDAGATFTDDVTPYENRKLWLLNGAHSLLAYLGSIRGHETVADAMCDEECRAWVDRWWLESGRHLGQAPAEVMAYTAALDHRFANDRMQHQLAQIAVDGSQKLPVRVLPTVHAELAAGRMPDASATVLGAWIAHLRGRGAAVGDVNAARLVELADGRVSEAVRRVLGELDALVADDEPFVERVAEAIVEIEGSTSP